MYITSQLTSWRSARQIYMTFELYSIKLFLITCMDHGSCAYRQ